MKSISRLQSSRRSIYWSRGATYIILHSSKWSVFLFVEKKKALNCLVALWWVEHLALVLNKLIRDHLFPQANWLKFQKMSDCTHDCETIGVAESYIYIRIYRWIFTKSWTIYVYKNHYRQASIFWGEKKKEGRKRHKPKPISLGFLFFFFFRCKYILVSIRRCFQDPSLRCHFRLLAMDAKHGQSQLSVQGRAESQLWLPETRTAEAVRILQGSARKAERRREILKNYCLQFCKGGFLKI